MTFEIYFGSGGAGYIKFEKYRYKIDGPDIIRGKLKEETLRHLTYYLIDPTLHGMHNKFDGRYNILRLTIETGDSTPMCTVETQLPGGQFQKIRTVAWPNPSIRKKSDRLSEQRKRNATLLIR